MRKKVTSQKYNTDFILNYAATFTGIIIIILYGLKLLFQCPFVPALSISCRSCLLVMNSLKPSQNVLTSLLLPDREFLVDLFLSSTLNIPSCCLLASMVSNLSILLRISCTWHVSFHAFKILSFDSLTTCPGVDCEVEPGICHQFLDKCPVLPPGSDSHGFCVCTVILPFP